mgnify:CR=1 FL=1
MAKKLSRTKLIKKLDTVFSQYIRQRDAENEIATCFTCGKKAHWKKLQNGHFQSRRFYATRWDEMNCQVQCAGCNVFKYGEQFVCIPRLVRLQSYLHQTLKNLLSCIQIWLRIYKVLYLIVLFIVKEKGFG